MSAKAPYLFCAHLSDLVLDVPIRVPSVMSGVSPEVRSSYFQSYTQIYDLADQNDQGLIGIRRDDKPGPVTDDM